MKEVRICIHVSKEGTRRLKIDLILFEKIQAFTQRGIQKKLYNSRHKWLCDSANEKVIHPSERHNRIVLLPNTPKQGETTIVYDQYSPVYDGFDFETYAKIRNDVIDQNYSTTIKLDKICKLSLYDLLKIKIKRISASRC